MASARQIAANQRNARLPRGPLSEAAIAAIRQNAVKHGLSAKHVVLRHEDPAEYEQLHDSLALEYLPQTPQELRLTDQIAQNYWRLLRCRRVETAAFENRLDTLKSRLNIDPNAAIDNDQGLSICMSNHAKDFDTLRRHETAIEKAWYRAIRELRTLQKERREQELAEFQERTNKANAAEPSSKAAAATVSEIGIGCVLQPAESIVKISESEAFCTNKPNSPDLQIGFVQQNEAQ